MYISPFEQGSQEWLEESRLCVTASEAWKIMPPKIGKKDFNKSAYDYADSMVFAQYKDDKPEIEERELSTYDIEWGNFYEPIARQRYEEVNSAEVEEIGFIKPSEQASYGCSVDGLIIGGGGIEIKCPSKPENFIRYVCGDWAEHTKQIQFCLFVTKRCWWDFVTFHPSFKDNFNYFQTRIFPDKELHSIFEIQLAKFSILVQEREKEFLKNLKNRS